jgi:adenosylhomocysteine nucleosidase
VSTAGPGPAIGVLCALPEELGSLREHERARRTRAGLEIHELEIEGRPALACVAGVGKVMAARAASLLLAEGAERALLVVGTCGGLRAELGPGTLVHCTIAAQVDLAHRHLREVRADETLRAAWQRVVPGAQGWFLTADRPVLSLWRRLRLARAFAGPCVAEMETAAAAAVAFSAGVPWAALRAVTDRATLGGGASFRLHFGAQAPRAADSIPALLAELAQGDR